MSRLYGRLLPGAAQTERTMRGHRDIGARLSTWSEHLETRLYIGRDDTIWAEIVIRSDADGASVIYDGRLDALAFYGVDAPAIWRDARSLGAGGTPTIPEAQQRDREAARDDS